VSFVVPWQKSAKPVDLDAGTLLQSSSYNTHKAVRDSGI